MLRAPHRAPEADQFKEAASTALFVPLALIFHEIAHLAAGLLFEVNSPVVHYAGFNHGVTPDLTRAQAATIAAAGPLATLLLAYSGLALAKRTQARWPTMIVFAASVRLIEILPYALPALSRRLLGFSFNHPTTFDEDVAARLIGLPGDISLIISAALLSWLLAQALRARPWRKSVGPIIGAITGLVVWLNVVGPLLLPRPT